MSASGALGFVVVVGGWGKRGGAHIRFDARRLVGCRARQAYAERTENTQPKPSARHCPLADSEAGAVQSELVRDLLEKKII